MMKVTCEIKDYSNPAKPGIKIHSIWNDKDKVELEVDGKLYTVISKELVAAAEKATFDSLWL